MPSLKLPNANVEFSYLDSGDPQSSAYTTIIVIHGHTFHSGVFRRLLPLAAPRCVRIIALNRRDYPGSTMFDASESNQLTSSNESERTSFLKARGEELAFFVAALIETLHLPEPSEDGTNGGIALMGWSLGNYMPISMINVAATLPEKVKVTLQHYIRRIVLYDAPHLAFGFQGPSSYLYTPFEDNTVPEANRGQVFPEWVSSYYSHKDLAARDANKLVDKVPDIRRTSTVSRMTQEELFSVVDPAAGQRSDTPLLTTMQPNLLKQTRTFLFNTGGSTRTSWSNVKIWVVYGESAAWTMPFAAWEMEKMDKSRNQKQTVKFHSLKEANHFFFWDDPKTALDAFLHCLEN